MTENASVAAHVGRPLLAATLIVVDRSQGQPRILMGRRRPDAVFLPDKYVFPGGRLEASDGDVPPVGQLPSHDAGCLARGLRGADRARAAHAFITAAIRETFEETGYLVAVDAPGTSSALPSTASPPDWRALLQAGIRPDLTQLRYVARAITPPGRPRRYDTRFFLAEASAVRAIYPRTDGELTQIGWFGLDRVSDHDLPSITRLVLADLAGALSPRQTPEIPFYFWRSGAFRRALLSQRAGSA